MGRSLFIVSRVFHSIWSRLTLSGLQGIQLVLYFFRIGLATTLSLSLVEDVQSIERLSAISFLIFLSVGYSFITSAHSTDGVSHRHS